MNGSAQIFVANLSPSVTDAELGRVFGAYGRVSEVNLLSDRVSGQSRGLAFVTMESEAQAQTAMDRLNATVLGGRALVLNLAKPRRSNSQAHPRRRAGGRRHDWQHKKSMKAGSSLPRRHR
jgi:RNA recognition motif-containing protein